MSSPAFGVAGFEAGLGAQGEQLRGAGLAFQRFVEVARGGGGIVAATVEVGARDVKRDGVGGDAQGGVEVGERGVVAVQGGIGVSALRQDVRAAGIAGQRLAIALDRPDIVGPGGEKIGAPRQALGFEHTPQPRAPEARRRERHDGEPSDSRPDLAPARSRARRPRRQGGEEHHAEGDGLDGKDRAAEERVGGPQYLRG